MGKKIYRSLFDNEEVFEVEEMPDKPTEDSAGCCGATPVEPKDEGEITNEMIFNLLKEIKESLAGSKVSDSEQDPNTGGSAEGKEPEKEMKVEKVDPVIDSDDKDEESEDVDAEKDVKDAYSVFTAVKDSAGQSLVQSAQEAFQARYNKVANK